MPTGAGFIFKNTFCGSTCGLSALAIGTWRAQEIKSYTDTKHSLSPSLDQYIQHLEILLIVTPTKTIVTRRVKWVWDIFCMHFLIGALLTVLLGLTSCDTTPITFSDFSHITSMLNLRYKFCVLNIVMARKKTLWCVGAAH